MEDKTLFHRYVNLLLLTFVNQFLHVLTGSISIQTNFKDVMLYCCVLN